MEFLKEYQEKKIEEIAGGGSRISFKIYSQKSCWKD